MIYSIAPSWWGGLVSKSACSVIRTVANFRWVYQVSSNIYFSPNARRLGCAHACQAVPWPCPGTIKPLSQFPSWPAPILLLSLKRLSAIVACTYVITSLRNWSSHICVGGSTGVGVHWFWAGVTSSLAELNRGSVDAVRSSEELSHSSFNVTPANPTVAM